MTTCTGSKEGAENIRILEGIETVSSNGAMTCQSEIFDILVEKVDEGGTYYNYTDSNNV